MEYYLQDIPHTDFLSIFIISALVIFFGMGYAAIFTVVKMRLIHKYYISLAYLSWIFLAFSMYYLGVLLRVEPYTQKVLIGAMVAYLIFPHAVYFILEKVHDKYENIN